MWKHNIFTRQNWANFRHMFCLHERSAIKFSYFVFQCIQKLKKPWKTAHGTKNVTKITRNETHKQIYYSFGKISFISWLYFACYRFACKNNNNNINKFGIVYRCVGGNFVSFFKNTILWWVADGVGIAWKAEIVIANVIIRTTRSNKTYSWISIKLNAHKIMSKKQFIQIIKSEYLTRSLGKQRNVWNIGLFEIHITCYSN